MNARPEGDASAAEDDGDGDRERDDEYEHDDEQLGPREAVTLFGRGLPRHLHRSLSPVEEAGYRRSPRRSFTPLWLSQFFPSDWRERAAQRARARVTRAKLGGPPWWCRRTERGASGGTGSAGASTRALLRRPRSRES